MLPNNNHNKKTEINKIRIIIKIQAMKQNSRIEWENV